MSDKIGVMKAVILAGGGGTRLWPLSTEEKPKQFQRLISDKTMIEETMDLMDFLKPEDIYIATNKNHVGLIRELCPKIPGENIIIEPALRDTASCIGLASLIIAHRHPNEVVSIIYTDYLIKNKKELSEKLRIAEKIAKKENTLNIVEIPAKRPDTGYGYVKVGEKISDGKAYELESFKEKPDKPTAEKFMEEGGYFWNTGLYVFKAKTMLEFFKEFQKDSYSKFMEISKHLGGETQDETILKIYPTLEKISIDYAIVEKVPKERVRIISANLNWTDIGNFETIYNALAKSRNENITRGNIKTLDAEGCLIYSDTERKTAVIGLKDIVVVDTKDGLLICKKDQSKRVKEIH